jgi:hypothetical protein
MTKMWLETNFTSVTILEFPEQQLLRIKSKESLMAMKLQLFFKNGNNENYLSLDLMKVMSW